MVVGIEELEDSEEGRGQENSKQLEDGGAQGEYSEGEGLGQRKETRQGE